MTDRPPIRALVTIVRGYYTGRWAMVMTVVLATIVGTADVLCPWMLGDAIDALISSQGSSSAGMERVILDAAIIGAFIAVQFVAHYSLARMLNAFIYSGSTKLRLDLATAIGESAADSSSQSRIGDLLTRFMADVQQLQDSLLEFLAEFPFDVVTLTGLAIAMLIRAPRLGLIVAAFLVIVIGVSILLGRRGWQQNLSAQDQAGVIGARLSEGAGAARTIATLGATSGERAALELEAALLEDHMLAGGKTRALVDPFFGFSEYLGLVMVLLLGGWFMLRGELSVGGLVCMLAYMEMAAYPIARCGRVLPRLQKAAASAVRVSGVLERKRRRFGYEVIAKPAGRIVFENASFTYPGGTRPALNTLRAAIEPGTRVAIIGRNGAGKSTLLDLLLGLQMPDKGRILIDGVDLSELARGEHARVIGVVPQDIVLLNRSIADNIALGIDRETVAAAASAAGLQELINHLPRGLDTTVGERGAALSGGQRQRIAIARLLARNPRIVILDEPTSALDALSEKEVLPAIERLCQGRTTFVVSHRPPLLETADRVLLLVHGEPLAYDLPEAVWDHFPQWRDLFPATWARTPATSTASTAKADP